MPSVVLATTDRLETTSLTNQYVILWTHVTPAQKLGLANGLVELWLNKRSRIAGCQAFEHVLTFPTGLQAQAARMCQEIIDTLPLVLMLGVCVCIEAKHQLTTGRLLLQQANHCRHNGLSLQAIGVTMERSHEKL